jgi:DNA-directed RNA polymerase subunit RPC12/RpoP
VLPSAPDTPCRERGGVCVGVDQPRRLLTGEGVMVMARSGTKPGRASYACSRCGAVQQLKTATAKLKACPSCGGSLFRKLGAVDQPVA